MPKRKTGAVPLLRRKTILAINLVLVSLIAWGFVGEYLRSRAMQAEIDRLEGQAGELEAKNLELADMADKYAGSSMLEREARLKLNMKRPGEEVVVIREAAAGIQETSTDETTGGETDTEDTAAISNMKKWIAHFFPKTNDK